LLVAVVVGFAVLLLGLFMGVDVLFGVCVADFFAVAGVGEFVWISKEFVSVGISIDSPRINGVAVAVGLLFDALFFGIMK